MNLLNSLQNYITAQKMVGINFMILGGLLILLSVMAFYFFPKVSITNGLKWGALVAGLLIGIGGFSYHKFSDNLQTEATATYESNKSEFIQSEHTRMDKVYQGFSTYQMTFSAILLLCLAVILFVGNPFYKGIAFAFALQVLGVMLIESFSHLSIATYTNELRSAIHTIQPLSK